MQHKTKVEPFQIKKEYSSIANDCLGFAVIPNYPKEGQFNIRLDVDDMTVFLNYKELQRLTEVLNEFWEDFLDEIK